MSLKNKSVQLALALLLGLAVLLLPRPEGTVFEIKGDPSGVLSRDLPAGFTLHHQPGMETKGYLVKALAPAPKPGPVQVLGDKAARLGLDQVRVGYVDGLSPLAKRFLAILAFLLFLFILEPIPLEITAICIGVLLILTGVTDAKGAWAPYMHPVVVFIMCCLIFAIALDKVGLTKRLGRAIARRAGDSVVRFTFLLSVGLGYASGLFHDAAAAAIGIATMLPLMKAAGIRPHTNTAKFMILSVAFACSAGGMGTLIGGGRCMVSAAFLKEFTGIEITFLDWIKFAGPAALVTVPLVVTVLYFVFRPDPKFKLPKIQEKTGPWSGAEKKTALILLVAFGLWMTKELHGFHYSVPGMLAVGGLVLAGVLRWEDIHKHLEWGTALFIFGGGIALGLGMDASGAARYLANLFFPLFHGQGWLVMFIGVSLFSALVTNAMANVAAAALILPIVIPLARLEGVDPRVLALCLGMATSCAMLLVIGCPPNAIAYSYRQFKAIDLTRAGLVAMPIMLVALILVCSLWWNLLGLV
jgi:solute carrier family 13 (sodium-dependent dicarboxylate transporter), member 2/3/5